MIFHTTENPGNKSSIGDFYDSNSFIASVYFIKQISFLGSSNFDSVDTPDNYSAAESKIGSIMTCEPDEDELTSHSACI